MSWAEIKKAVNSDLDVPLNELTKRQTQSIIDYMNKPRGRNLKCYYVSTKNTTDAPISFAGKYLIHGVYMNTNNATLQFYIEYDGHRIYMSERGETYNKTIICLSNAWEYISESTSGSLFQKHYQNSIWNCDNLSISMTWGRGNLTVYTLDDLASMDVFGGTTTSFNVEEPIIVNSYFKSGNAIKVDNSGSITVLCEPLE